MDSRERVARALSFEEPDRVPTDFWASAGFAESLARATGMDMGTFLDRHDVDLRYIAGPRYIGPPLRPLADGSEPDLWGVPRRSVLVEAAHGRERYQEVSAHPLAACRNAEDVAAYGGWPSPDWFDYSVIRGQCLALRNKGRVVVFMGDRLNRVAQLKPAMYLRGIEQIFLDLAEAPDLAAAIFARIRAFYAEYLARILDAADGLVDLVLTGDDFGAQNGPLLSPGMWERFLADGFAEYARLIHAHGARMMHHTCGMVTPLVPKMLERGLDVLQSLQPEAMASDLPALKRDFGRRLGFHGGISIQHTLPHGTTEDVRREVRERLAVLAPGGGYILGAAHNIQADCPPANAVALLDACREYGRYRG